MKLGSYGILLVLGLSRITASAAGMDIEFGQAAGAELFLSHDNEGFTTQRIAVEYVPFYQNVGSLTGMRYTQHSYEQNNWSRSGQQLTFFQRHIDPSTTNGWQLDTGWFLQGGHALLTLDGNYQRALAEHTGVALFIDREWVETAKALDHGLYFTFAGISLEQEIGTHLTVVAVAGRQDFSDGNVRNHGRLKLILQPDPDSGLTYQVRYRAYSSSYDNIGGFYFNPVNYNEVMLALGWRKKISGWNLSLTGGVGQQKVGGGSSTPTQLLEGSMQTAADRPYSLRLRAGLNQSAAFNGPNYRYSYLLSEWIIPF